MTELGGSLGASGIRGQGPPPGVDGARTVARLPPQERQVAEPQGNPRVIADEGLARGESAPPGLLRRSVR